MSVFSSLFKTKKQNLTPQFSNPNASDAPNFGSLSQLAKQRIQAGTTGEETPGVGFGQDFVSKTTNPVIAQRNATFREQTMPFLSSQLSARGVGRSGGTGLATGIVGQAELQKNRDVDEIFSKMFQLNEAQKKQDITQGIGVGQGLDSNFLNQGNLKASAAERLANVTAADSVRRESQDRQNAMRIGAVGAAPFTGGASLSAMPQTTPTQPGGGLYQGELSDYSSLKGSDIYNKWLNGQFNALGAN